jgi:nitrogen fixation/metabolism regulation signal transduction histidine kinase
MNDLLMKLTVMLEEDSMNITEETIYEMVENLGNIVEDVEHYPTLPDSVEELAELLELDIEEASDEIIDALEEIVINHRNYTYEQLRWNDLLGKEVF